MSEFNNSHTSLDDVHVGDHVAMNLKNDNYWILATVTADTKTTITVNGKKFMRSNGYERGIDRSRFTASYDRIKTLGQFYNRDKKETFADRIRFDVPRRNAAHRRRIAYTFVRDVDWSEMPIEVLEAVVSIVEAEKAKDETK